MAKRTITLQEDITVTVTLEVEIDPEFDDDGCGPPSKTGNSMTGNRGLRGYNAVDYSIDHADVKRQVEEFFTPEFVQDLVDHEEEL